MHIAAFVNASPDRFSCVSGIEENFHFTCGARILNLSANTPGAVFIISNNQHGRWRIEWKKRHQRRAIFYARRWSSTHRCVCSAAFRFQSAPRQRSLTKRWLHLTTFWEFFWRTLAWHRINRIYIEVQQRAQIQRDVRAGRHFQCHFEFILSGLGFGRK